MAKTAGYVTPDEFGYEGTLYDTDSTDYLFYTTQIVLQAPLAANKYKLKAGRWATSLMGRNRFALDWFATDGAENVVSLVFVGQGENTSVCTTANGTGAWGLGSMPGSFPSGGSPPVHPIPGHSPFTARGPSYTVLRVQRVQDAADSDPNIFCMYCEPHGYHDIYDVGNPVDRIERTTESNKAYTTNRPLSSWQVTNLLSTIDRLMYEARYIINVPLISQTTIPS